MRIDSGGVLRGLGRAFTSDGGAHVASHFDGAAPFSSACRTATTLSGSVNFKLTTPSWFSVSATNWSRSSTK
ncbi:MAG: hypothetical protein QM775_16570 [Pirellulales bacterium]